MRFDILTALKIQVIVFWVGLWYCVELWYGSKVLRNVGILPHHYITSQPTRPWPKMRGQSCTTNWKGLHRKQSILRYYPGNCLKWQRKITKNLSEQPMPQPGTSWHKLNAVQYILEQTVILFESCLQSFYQLGSFTFLLPHIIESLNSIEQFRHSWCLLLRYFSKRLHIRTWFYFINFINFHSALKYDFQNILQYSNNIYEPLLCRKMIQSMFYYANTNVLYIKLN